MITQNELKETMKNDHNTGKFTWLVANSSKIKIGDRAGSLNSIGYRRIKINGKDYLEHRLVWLYHYGYLPTKHLDHINGIRDDNRIDNLREATSAENHQNRSKSKNNTSGFMGVTWAKHANKWQSRICKGGKNHHLGYYDTPEEAHAAYVKTKAELHTFNPTIRTEHYV